MALHCQPFIQAGFARKASRGPWGGAGSLSPADPSRPLPGPIGA